MKPLYVAATVMDSGKTCFSIGLLQALRNRNLNPGYFKPVGQHYISYQNCSIDEDAALIHEIFKLNDNPQYLNPIAVERGFTQRFIENPDVTHLENKILNSAEQLLNAHSSLIVEGTGHAGVGSCFGLSNAKVASLLNAKVIIITRGGIGKPIDEIALSLALFEKHNVPVLGVILNKVLTDKYQKVTESVSKGLKHLGTTLLASIPYEPFLRYFSVGQLIEEFGYNLLCGSQFLSNKIERIVVAAMEPENAASYIKEGTLVIVPYDRTDNILACVEHLSNFAPKSGGILLTGNSSPDHKVAEVLKNAPLPALISEMDTFTVSVAMKDVEFKIRNYDSEKITKLHSLISDYINVGQILDELNS